MNAGAHKKLNAYGKLVVMRHGHAPKRSYNAAEKAVESKVRQQGKQEIRRSLRGEER